MLAQCEAGVIFHRQQRAVQNKRRRRGIIIAARPDWEGEVPPEPHNSHMFRWAQSPPLFCMLKMLSFHMRLKEVWGLLKSAASNWSHHHDARLGAALSYYTIFAIPPLFVIIIYIAS